jgi:hypothetical protein
MSPAHRVCTSSPGRGHSVTTILPWTRRPACIVTASRICSIGKTAAIGTVILPTRIASVIRSYEIDQNGVKIAGGNAVRAAHGNPDLFIRATLSRKPLLIRFALNASGTAKSFPQSNSSRTVWTWRSVHRPGATVRPGWFCPNAPGQPPSRHCAVQPMMTVSYHVAGLSLSGTVAAVRQAVDLTIGHIQLATRSRISRAELQASFNGGRTWQPARVRRLSAGRFRAVFAAPPSRPVALRIFARDATRGTITETILRAFKAPPAAPLVACRGLLHGREDKFVP